ncbi:glycosyltransferase [Bremerella sp. JC817]|uniref:glycosyltransferase family 4 protein n=1 Tax=Bremerella sp. JC817 TaxID=3231756 RepID=UPI0034589479
MKMKNRIALICEPLFMYHHVGVRNYIYSLARLLSTNSHVDFVSYYRSPTGALNWYRLTPQNPNQLWGNTSAEDLSFSGTPQKILTQFDATDHQSGAHGAATFYKSHIGPDLQVENYDLGIITTPWLVEFTHRLPMKQLVGIVYDMVPNTYVFAREEKPYDFAARHCQGFVYYRDHCDAILTISEQVASSFQETFRIPEGRVTGLPPLLPSSYHRIPVAENKRDAQVILASPFDLRKGLKVMPAILNQAKSKIEKLVIYGGVRCAPKDVYEFFEDLQVESVVWYPNASSAITHQLFRESKALLFPSFDEGLGLPILEAQAHGCRVMVRDKRPMCDLTGPGAEFLADDVAENGKILEAMIDEPFDHQSLQRWTVDAFSTVHVLKTLCAALGDHNPKINTSAAIQLAAA